MESLDEIYQYWSSVGWSKFFRVFWYFFAIDFFRYILIDFFALSHYIRERRRRKKDFELAKAALWAEHPLISVIVPGKNEGKHLYKLTRSIKEQSYQHLELIVVDDGSDDQTKIIGRDLEKNGLIDLFIRNDVRGGKASGANTALHFCKGKYVIHLDADCSFNYDAFEKILVPFYYDASIAAVGGNLEVRNSEDSLATKLQAIEYLKSILIGRIASSYLGFYRIISGAFGAFEIEKLKRLGGWDIGPGLDGDITMKFRKLGYKVHFEPTALGLTSVPDSFRKLAKQRRRWNKSIVRFRMRKHLNVFRVDANFSWSNMLSSAENIFYNVILNVKWYIYILDVAANFGGMLMYIVPTNLLMYAIANFIQMFVIVLFVEDKKAKAKFLWYAPIMVLYMGFFLRFVRTVAQLEELLFKKSYDDNWNPYKSSKKAKALGL